KRDSFIGLSFEVAFEVGERLEAPALVLADPALGDLVDRDGVQEVQLLAAAPQDGDEIRVFQNFQVLRDGLPGHVEMLRELSERLAVVGMELVQQEPAAGIGGRLERLVEVSCHGSHYATVRLHVKRTAIAEPGDGAALAALSPRVRRRSDGIYPGRYAG